MIKFIQIDNKKNNESRNQPDVLNTTAVDKTPVNKDGSC